MCDSHLCVCAEVSRDSQLQRSVQVTSRPGVQCEGPLSPVFPCSLRVILLDEREGDSGEESVRGKESWEAESSGGGDKTAACLHPTFYSSVNPFV